MDTYWFNKLLDTLRVQTNSDNEKLMVLYLDKELGKLKLPYTIDAVGNVIVTKGKAKTYPCVTAHMDTVHDFADNFEIYKDIKDNDILFALDGETRVGIGGDDKCGVFACLYLLKVIPQIKVVFFSREEVGCKGSMGINKAFFADCRYLIQLDRNGSRDFIQTYCIDKTISHDFSSEIGVTKKKYRYKNATGTVTDVMKLWKNKVGVSCINLSCGYYGPHTDHEYVSISALWNSIKFTEEIINNMKPKKYASLPPKPTVIKTSYQSNLYNKKFDSRDTYLPSHKGRYVTHGQCYKCYNWKKYSLLIYQNDYKYICWMCKEKLDRKTPKPPSIAVAVAASTKPAVKNDVVNNNTVFACSECGIRKDQMKGGTLKLINGLLYCNMCALLVSVPADKTCWACKKVIPKDHKIIERYGVRVCEDCACPSDNVME